jgi:hypothetical protein
LRVQSSKKPFLLSPPFALSPFGESRRKMGGMD